MKKKIPMAWGLALTLGLTACTMGTRESSSQEKINDISQEAVVEEKENIENALNLANIQPEWAYDETSFTSGSS